MTARSADGTVHGYGVSVSYSLGFHLAAIDAVLAAADAKCPVGRGWSFGSPKLNIT